MTKDERETLAAELERSGDYKILRRLQPRGCDKNPVNNDDTNDGAPIFHALFLDVETTGLDPYNDEIIELSMVPFTYTGDGRIVDVLPAFDRLRQPAKPISAAITRLTGITDAMVQGQEITAGEIAAVIESAQLLVAHHSAFDRRFAERLHPGFADVAWACSMSQAPWQLHGYEGLKLTYLLHSSGLFHDGHRGLSDCHAAIELLARPLGATGQTALAHVLEAAGRTTWRLRATGAPYAFKDALRARGYRWNAGFDGKPRAWFIDCDEAGVEAETVFLQAEVFGSNWTPTLSPITGLNRFSDRV